MHAATDDVVVIYSENYWLFQGVRSLLGDYEVMFYSELSQRDTRKVVVCVDSKILLNSGALNLKIFLDSINVDRVVWLMHGETGMVYPLWSSGDYVLKIKNRYFMKNLIHILRGSKSINNQYYETLTITEELIMFYLSKGLNIEQISFITEKTSKTVYQHRSKIMQKLGYRNNVFFQYIFIKNGDLMWENRNDSVVQNSLFQ